MAPPLTKKRNCSPRAPRIFRSSGPAGFTPSHAGHSPGKIEIGQQQGAQGPGQLPQLALHPLIEMLQHLGREHQNGDPLFLDALQDGLGLQGVQISDPGPGKKRHQQGGGEGKGVMQGQDGQKIVLGPDGVEPSDPLAIGTKIFMAEHHPFGHAGGARGVDDGG